MTPMEKEIYLDIMANPDKYFTPEDQYLELLRKAHYSGEKVWVPRTNCHCWVVTGGSIVIDASTATAPLITTRKMHLKPIIAEVMGYFKGFTNAEQFRNLGTRTWDANANLTQAWLANPKRKGEDDLGFIYGAVAQNWPKHDGTTINLFEKVYNNLRQGIDDRGEIITYWNPGLFELGALRPCMFQHQFILLNGVLHLESYSRSCDGPLGGAANILQAWFMLKTMAWLTGHQCGKIRMTFANFHIYENQMSLIPEQLSREVLPAPTLKFNRTYNDLADFIATATPDDLSLEDYISWPAIKYPFSE
jgi:thymidylate synthase